MKRIVVLAIIFWCHHVYCQKESANWYFGEFAGLNFNNGDPVPLLDGKLATSEGCATISDSNGNLLFYTNGVTVWDRRHEVMPNGTGLLGHSSSTESALIVPKPGSSTRYYIFTIDKPSYYLTEDEPIDGVNYSEVDMELNGGYGAVVGTTKNVHLVTYDQSIPIQNEYKSSEKITAILHGNGSAVWVITHFVNKFYAFRVEADGVNHTPVITETSFFLNPIINAEGANISAIGYLKISPNGEKIAIAHSSTSLGSPRSGTKRSGKVMLYDFNNQTGVVSNQEEIFFGSYPYGVEFSTNSKLLYITDNDFNSSDIFVHSHLYQFDLEANDIYESREILSTTQNVAGALQLAINGKIYRAGYHVSGAGERISVINKPNVKGSGCDYSENSVSLGGRQATLGLPPFIQSLFLPTFDYENTCFGDETVFKITSEDPFDSVLWDFGDGETSTEVAPRHTYTQPGDYMVTLSLTADGVSQNPFIKQVSITTPPEVLDYTYDLIQCDNYDGNPDDGRADFNLQLANGPLTNYTYDIVYAYYYKTIEDAIQDESNLYALNNIYRNDIAEEILYAKLFTSDQNCYSIATVRLLTSETVELDDNSFESCAPYGETKADFDLGLMRADLLDALDLTADVNLTFHERLRDAAIGINPLPEVYNSRSKTIYFRLDLEGACYGSGELHLNVKNFPKLDDQIVTVCSKDFPVAIQTGLTVEQRNDYNYTWTHSNEISNSVLVSEEGMYEVRVEDPLLECFDYITVEVVKNDPPEIIDLRIDGLSVSVTLSNYNEDYLYALDNPDGGFTYDSTFMGISPGDHTIYVKDSNDCYLVSQNFYLLGFPKYFTPNGDGIHDTWNVYGLDQKYQSEQIMLQIFNRFGKLLKTYNPFQSSWDGTLKGKLLSSDDYWYYMKLPTGEEYKGHFALKL
ncbi:T9SS type B sorting domain-containing protein [Aestuariivivens sediminicola]|uniref:T9SS type B sorting domain-containing protein n=1 Tax=Aestuariivivens sediminicola TaxID=2913560 RepID=UPI002412211C|nr:T9SS type B sorting domain-containing protein [Aestuariivivens sediminicola]